jgi:hypothetical protein
MRKILRWFSEGTRQDSKQKWREREKERLANLGALDPNTAITNVKNDGTDDDSRQDGEKRDGSWKPESNPGSSKEDATILDGRKNPEKKPDDTHQSDGNVAKSGNKSGLRLGSLKTPISPNKGEYLHSSYILCLSNKF